VASALARRSPPRSQGGCDQGPLPSPGRLPLAATSPTPCRRVPRPQCQCSGWESDTGDSDTPPTLETGLSRCSPSTSFITSPPPTCCRPHTAPTKADLPFLSSSLAILPVPSWTPLPGLSTLPRAVSSSSGPLASRPWPFRLLLRSPSRRGRCECRFACRHRPFEHHRQHPLGPVYDRRRACLGRCNRPSRPRLAAAPPISLRVLLPCWACRS
jgi:hypothetical protein